MPRGGKRPGAGRKPGRLSNRTIARKELASAAAGEGITPLELMLKRMRYYHSLAEREMRKGEEADRHIIDAALKAANESAKDAAPFLHPRLSAVEHTGSPVDAITEFLKLIDGTTPVRLAASAGRGSLGRLGLLQRRWTSARRRRLAADRRHRHHRSRRLPAPRRPRQGLSSNPAANGSARSPSRNAAMSHPGVLQAAVIGIAHPEGTLVSHPRGRVYEFTP
jgi:hypothetical protein